MGSPCPPHWTLAARAAYFGDRLCYFCDHRNPGDAKFCNDCGSPLHLKPCNQCDAVNHQAATNCSKCGAACPVLFGTPEATPILPATDPTPAWATPGDVAGAATVTQSLFAASALRAGWRLRRPGQFILAAIATILIAGAYAAYRINAATPDAMGVASQPIGAREHNAPTATPPVPMAVESKPVEPERTAAFQAPIPATNPEAPRRTSARQRPVPVPATERASAHQRTVPERHAPVGATPPVAHSLAAARVGARVVETRKALRPDPWQMMHVSLARCGGDLIARIVCDQRVRRHFCEGHWGEAQECASGVGTEHGQ
jgi:ribosomal protein L40E